ncbi:MAG: 2-phosphosulfolactate phosphatase [Fuerstiella sp.]
MSRSLNVHLLPAVFSPDVVAGGIVVMVDILRASTTMTVALANGASGVVPCLHVDDAFALRDSKPNGKCLLGGERGGVKIDGFDFGNSPRDYSPEVVAGKVLAFTTTNGTRALHHSRQAAEILIGCFLNLTSVVHYLQQQSTDIHIVCAGTNGEITSEDVLFGGCLADMLMSCSAENFQCSDSTRLAMDHWQAHCGDLQVERLHQAIRGSQGGKNLIVLGYDEDIRFVSQIDSVQALAKLSEDGTLRLVSTAASHV